MIIIEPKVELIEQNNIKEHVCKCARVCYGKESGNDDVLYNNLINSHHWSMFRHASYYAIVPINDIKSNSIYQIYDYSYQTIGIDIHKDRNSYYVVYNGNFALDYPNAHEFFTPYLVSPKEFDNTERGYSMMRYSFLVTTQISTSRELNRVSPNNISEASTRYINLSNGAICRPHWMSKQDAIFWNDGNTYMLTSGSEMYCRECERAFDDYRKLIEQFNYKREDARGILPLDTATVAVYTYDISTWRHIIELRTAKAAHPNAQIIANMIKKELEELGYDFNI